MNRSVLPVGSDVAVDEALRTLTRLDFSVAPVLDEDGRLIGTVTAESLRRACAQAANPQARGHRFWWQRPGAPIRVSTVMDTPAVALTPGAQMAQVRSMLAAGTPAVLVVDGDSVVGIIGIEDLARAPDDNASADPVSPSVPATPVRIQLRG